MPDMRIVKTENVYGSIVDIWKSSRGYWFQIQGKSSSRWLRRTAAQALADAKHELRADRPPKVKNMSKSLRGRRRDSRGRLLPKSGKAKNPRLKKGILSKRAAIARRRRDSKGRLLPKHAQSGSYILVENPKKRRKGRKRGVTPPHLRKYLFKKGHR